MWHQVMHQAFIDAVNGSEEARRWFLSRDARIVADLADWDPGHFEVFLSGIAERGWPAPTRKRMAA